MRIATLCLWNDEVGDDDDDDSDDDDKNNNDDGDDYGSDDADDDDDDEDDGDVDDTAGSRRVVQLLEKMTRDWPKETHSKSPKWATAENSFRSSLFSKSSSSSPSSILMSTFILLPDVR